VARSSARDILVRLSLGSSITRRKHRITSWQVRLWREAEVPALRRVRLGSFASFWSSAYYFRFIPITGQF
jgi:hypothetical protein